MIASIDCSMCSSPLLADDRAIFWRCSREQKVEWQGELAVPHIAVLILVELECVLVRLLLSRHEIANVIDYLQ